MVLRGLCGGIDAGLRERRERRRRQRLVKIDAVPAADAPSRAERRGHVAAREQEGGRLDHQRLG